MSRSAGVSDGFGRWPGGNISGCGDRGISNMGTKLGIIITNRGSTIRLSLYQGFVKLAAPFVVSECCLVLMPGFLIVATHTSVAGIEVVPVAPAVVFDKVAPHGAWSKNMWESSVIFALFEPGHFKTESGDFSIDVCTQTMCCRQFQVQPCIGGVLVYHVAPIG